jgi:carbon-monoxide dehydrogenase medium subunit
MRRFELLEPRSLPEAVTMLAADPEAKVIAGGTALLIVIKHGVYLPGTLVNLRKVKDASGISWDAATGLRIGALASIFQVESHPVVREQYPVLHTACHVVANIRIRNLATIGGNLAHADYQSDPPSALVALGARVEITGPGGTREAQLSDFLIGSYETDLATDEVLSAILVPPPARDTHGTYLKFTTRSSEDRPCAAVTAQVRLAEGGAIDEASLVVGAVSPAPVRVTEAEALARDARPSPELFAAMGEACSRAVDPIADLRGSADYKRHLVGVLAERALAQATSGALAARNGGHA